LTIISDSPPFFLHSNCGHGILLSMALPDDIELCYDELIRDTKEISRSLAMEKVLPKTTV
jgi:hypothetical protein